MTTKSEHEEAAFGDLVRSLREQGRDAEVIARPDQDSSDPLTVDAMLRLDGEVIAVDHCLLSRPKDLPSAVDRAKSELTTLLGPIAIEAGKVLLVSFQPQTGQRGERWGSDYYPRFVGLARAAVETNQEARLDDGISAVKAFEPPEGIEPMVDFMYIDDITGSGLISAQVEAGIRAAVTKKLNGQLRHAKRAGFRTGLLMDQQPRPGGNSAIWPAGPETVASVVAGLVAEHQQDNPPVLDLVWFRATRFLEAERSQVRQLIPSQP